MDAILDAVRIEVGGELVDLSCMDRRVDTATAPLLAALPRGADDYVVTVPSQWAGFGSVTLAFYTEAAWATASPGWGAAERERRTKFVPWL